MIRYQDEGMYMISVFNGNYKIGTILSNEGAFWWFKPNNGMPGKVYEGLNDLKRAIQRGEHE